MTKIQRYFHNSTFKAIQKDFAFLFLKIKKSLGELDFQIRENYFNLYFRGNSLAKVVPLKNGYQVYINRKFLQDKGCDNFLSAKYPDKSGNGDYYVAILTPEQLHPFFCNSHLDKIYANIKQINFKEELVFEHSLITDNLANEDWLIIDRQITDTALAGKRMDLLALKKDNCDNSFSFIVLEIKLGNNPELSDKVATQLNSYINHIKSHISEYQEAYESNYFQKYQLGLINNNMPASIVINDKVDGRIVVGWYSGIGKRKIDELKAKRPEYSDKIITYFNVLK